MKNGITNTKAAITGIEINTAAADQSLKEMEIVVFFASSGSPCVRLANPFSMASIVSFHKIRFLELWFLHIQRHPVILLCFRCMVFQRIKQSVCGRLPPQTFGPRCLQIHSESFSISLLQNGEYSANPIQRIRVRAFEKMRKRRNRL